MDRLEGDSIAYVFGLGTIGFVEATEMLACGLTVTGWDTDPAVRERWMQQDRPWLCDSPKGLVRGDVIVVCVPTPPEAPERHLRQVLAVLRLSKVSGVLLSVHSTVPPGSTERVFAAWAEETGSHLSYSPERYDPGNPKHPPRIVGANTVGAMRAARNFYAKWTEIAGEGAIQEAEAAKCYENLSRGVSLATVQSFAAWCGGSGISCREAVRLAATKSGVLCLQPGAGIGGACIPAAPRYLGATSDLMAYTVALVAGDICGRIGTPKNALIVGSGYKRTQPDDERGSPALELIRQMRAIDPTFTARVVNQADAVPADLSCYDLVILSNPAHDFDFSRIWLEAKTIYDCCHASRCQSTTGRLVVFGEPEVECKPGS